VATFELSYAGRPFVIPDADLMDRVSRWLKVMELPIIDTPGWPYPGANATRLGVQPPPVPAGVGLYELYVPPKASAWTVFRGLMHKKEVANLSTGIFTFVMSDGTGRAIGNLALLPPQPLLGLDGAADLYLVTLVDRRYLGNTFLFHPTAVSNFGSAGTWAGMIGGAADAATFGGPVTITNDGISTASPAAVYGTPEIDSDLYAWDGPGGVQADASLDSCGMLLVADMAGSISTPYMTLRYDATPGFTAAARAAAAPDRAAGGLLWASDTDPRLGLVLPNVVTVNFPEWCDGVGYANVFRYGANLRSHGGSGGRGACQQITVTAASLGPPYSTLPVAPTFGNPPSINTTAKAILSELSPSATILNTSDLNALATQLAKDFYDRARSGGVCETYRGIVPFDCRAGCYVVYSYWPEPMTRVWGGPINDFCRETFHNIDAGKSSSAPGLWVARDTAPILILSGSGPYVGQRCLDTGSNPVAWPRLETVLVTEMNGAALVVGKIYLCRRSATDPRVADAWTTDAASGSSSLTVGTTPVSGGTTGGVLYSNGSTLQSAGNLVIAGAGNTPSVQAASGKWVSQSIGSH
jgi:hypothetical protein